MQNNIQKTQSHVQIESNLAIGTGNVLSPTTQCLNDADQLLAFMYPLDRLKESELFKSDAVHVRVYTITPQVNISILAELSPDQVTDLQNAVDSVLKFHNL